MSKSLSVLLIIFILLSYSCGNKNVRIYKINGFTMGTTYSIKISDYNTNLNINISDIRDRVKKELKRINMIFSTYINDSDISKFNNCKGTDWFDTSKELVSIVSIALNVSKLSDGYYDITVGPLVNLWGFGPKKEQRKVPEDSEIKDVLKLIGYKKISIKKNPYQLKKDLPDMYIDLSSIAKGYGVDRIYELLKQMGFSNFLIEIGGEVRTSGVKSEKKDWLIGIASPKNGFSVNRVVKLKDLSMATSGDYRNYFEKNGIRYSHTIDPKTGYPIKHKLASVSVIHKSCTLADAYATAIDVMGEKRGMKFAESLKLPVYMIIRKNNGFKIYYSKEFEKYL